MVDIFYADDDVFAAELASDFLADTEEIDHLSVVVAPTYRLPLDFQTSDVLKTSSAEDLLAVIQSTRPRIVLLDFDMQSITGLQILEALKTEDPDQFIKRKDILKGVKPEQGQLLFAILSADIKNPQIELRQELNKGNLAFLLAKRPYMHEIWETLALLAEAYKTGADVMPIILKLEEFHQRACEIFNV